MMRKLNGWQRLGIVASVAWMLFGAVVTINWSDEQHKKTTDWALDVCWKGADKTREERYRNLDAKHLQYSNPELDASRKSIEGMMDREYKACADKVWMDYPFPGLAPLMSKDFLWAPIILGMGWLLCWGTLGLGRWVRAGFRQARQ